MDFAFFAIAFNIKKMCSKIAKQTKNGGNTPQNGLFSIMLQILTPENRIFWRNLQKTNASLPKESLLRSGLCDIPPAI